MYEPLSAASTSVSARLLGEVMDEDWLDTPAQCQGDLAVGGSLNLKLLAEHVRDLLAEEVIVFSLHDRLFSTRSTRCWRLLRSQH